jgi:Ca-activated chloride channel family protein
MMNRLLLLGVGLAAACSSGQSNGALSADGGFSPSFGGADLGAVGNGGFGNVGVGGGQDFAAFRAALDHNQVPAPSTLDSGGFFAEHYTSLPVPSCGETFCLHALLSVAPDLVVDGARTLVQLGMNSPVDPDTVQKPPLDLVVVLDRSGSMQDANKIGFAKTGLTLLVDQLADTDRLTLITFSSDVTTEFGPAPIAGQRDALKAKINAIVAGGATDIYDALKAGYQAALAGSLETEQRRILFLTDGLPTEGDVIKADILSMSQGFNEQYVGLTAIGLGTDVDADLLRKLAEQGGGNFYFLEQPSAVTEVFTQELKFFVAPIAYDVELDLAAAPGLSIGEVFGTNLYVPNATGGKINVPAVFLVSRQSSAPDSTGGRRGGGAAILADMNVAAPGTAGPNPIADVSLSYRSPGETTRHLQHVSVVYDGLAGVVPVSSPDGYFSDPSIAKNTIMLAFYRAFRGAVDQAAAGDKAGALALLQTFRPRAAARLVSFTDADLADDLHLVDRFITVLGGP